MWPEARFVSMRPEEAGPERLAKVGVPWLSLHPGTQVAPAPLLSVQPTSDTKALRAFALPPPGSLGDLLRAQIGYPDRA
jgi:hypothetical protein